MQRLRSLTIKRLTIIASVAGLSFGTTAISAGAAPTHRLPAVSGALPSCTSAGLVVWLDTVGSGSAGGSYFDLEFTNVSGHTCTLDGYPGVSAIDVAGHQLGSAASRDTVSPVHKITLHSATSTAGLPPLGGTVTASVVLKITDVGVYSPSQCHYVTAAGLRVYPPNQTTAKVVPYPFAGCARRGAIFLQVGAIVKAALP